MFSALLKVVTDLYQSTQRTYSSVGHETAAKNMIVRMPLRQLPVQLQCNGLSKDHGMDNPGVVYVSSKLQFNCDVKSQACGVPLAKDQHDAWSFGVFSLTP